MAVSLPPVETKGMRDDGMVHPPPGGALEAGETVGYEPHAVGHDDRARFVLPDAVVAGAYVASVARLATFGAYLLE